KNTELAPGTPGQRDCDLLFTVVLWPARGGSANGPAGALSPGRDRRSIRSQVAAMNFGTAVLEHSLVYHFWQAPFAKKKFSPILAHNDLGRARRVLDVGCGPGTNTRYFGAADYLGLDCNPKYIEYGRRHYKREFLVADATTYAGAADR